MTPLSKQTPETVRLIGSGSYVERNGKRLLLSCEHVSAKGPLDHRYHGSDDVFPVRGEWTATAHPVDVAFAEIGDAAWHATQHSAAVIPYARFAANHGVCQRAELLFFRGFADENARYGFGVHEANASGYCSQEKEGSGDTEQFEIFWEPEKTQVTQATSADARSSIKYDDPHGFSGSLVWNTRFLETWAAGQEWSPEDAVITGIARRWDDKTKTLLVYRVEHLRRWLDQH